MEKKPLYSLLQKTKLLFPSLTALWRARTAPLATLPSVHKKLLLIVSIIIVMLLLWPTSADNSDSASDYIRKRIELNVSTPQNVANNSTSASVDVGNNNSTAAAAKVIIEAVKTLDPNAIDGNWHKHEIHKGDSVYRIFRQYDIPAAVLHELIALKPAQQDITAVAPGQTLAFYISTQGQLVQLRISGTEHATAIFMLREDGSYSYEYE